VSVPSTRTDWPAGVAPGETAEEPGGAAQATTSAVRVGYVEPCPPPDDGPHTYRFVLYAVDATLDVAPGADRAEMASALDARCCGVSILEDRFDW